MCSSPKSSGAKRPRRAPSKTFAEGLTSAQRARFTEVANRAEQRLETHKRWQQTYANKASQEFRHERSKSYNTGLFTWFTQLFTGH